MLLKSQYNFALLADRQSLLVSIVDTHPFRPPAPAGDIADRNGNRFLLSNQHDQFLAPGDPGVEQITLQHSVVLRHDRDYHGRVFRALALVNGCGVSRHQGVEFAEAISDKALVKGCGKLSAWPNGCA
jgi:hypothetical protein